MGSFGDFIALDDVKELVEILFLHFFEFSAYEALSVNAIKHLFLKFFDARFHPMIVVEGGFDILLIKLFFNVAPNLAYPEMRVKLNNLNFLLFMSF